MQTGYKVIDVMTTKPVTARKDMLLTDAAKQMGEVNINSLLIVEGEIAIGILTDEDIVRKVIAKGLDGKKLLVKDVMVTDLISTTPEKDIYDALLLMRDNNIRQLPVIKSKKVIGFLTSKDILKIEPELIDLLVEKYSIREEANPVPEEYMDPISGFFRKLGIKKKK